MYNAGSFGGKDSQEEKWESNWMRKQYSYHFLQKYIDGQMQQVKEMNLALERMRVELWGFSHYLLALSLQSSSKLLAVW